MKGTQCRLQRAVTFPSTAEKSCQSHTRSEQIWAPRAETGTATICKSVTSLTPARLPWAEGTGGHTELCPKVWGHGWGPQHKASGSRPQGNGCRGLFLHRDRPCPAWEQRLGGTWPLSLWDTATVPVSWCPCQGCWCGADPTKTLLEESRSSRPPLRDGM